jgi:hypothetical protein
LKTQIGSYFILICIHLLNIFLIHSFKNKRYFSSEVNEQLNEYYDYLNPIGQNVVPNLSRNSELF